jgi:hypothetical protein
MAAQHLKTTQILPAESARLATGTTKSDGLRQINHYGAVDRTGPAGYVALGSHVPARDSSGQGHRGDATTRESEVAA